MTSKYDTPVIDFVSENPATWLKPDESLMANGLDWSWAYVIYREIPDFPDYSAGSNGQIWRRRMVSGQYKWIKLKIQNRCGYRRVYLFRNGKRITRSVHHLVLESFVGPRPVGKEGCHSPDPTRSNNNLWNLRWDTHVVNSEDATKYRKKNGLPSPTALNATRGERSSFAKITEADVLEIRRMAYEGVFNQEIADRFGLYLTHISLIITGRSWGHVDPEGIIRLKERRKVLLSGGRGRPRKGATRLVESDVREIRKLRTEGMGAKELCAKFKIKDGMLRCILNRKTWAYLE